MTRSHIAATIVCILTLAATAASAQAPVHVWSQNHGSTSFDTGYSLAADLFGNVMVTGSFNGTVDFGGGPLVSAGATDIFLARYTPDGTHLWSQRFGGTGSDVASSVAIDPSNNVLVTGFFNGTVDFGGGPLVSAGVSDIFIAKYSGGGVHTWSQRFGSTGGDGGNSIESVGLGDLVFTGYFNGAVNFGGGVLTSAGGSDIVVARFSAAGGHTWSRRFGSTTSDSGFSATADGFGVTITGFFTGTADFGGGAMASAGGSDIFLARYDFNGNHVWSKRFGAAGGDIGYSVTSDASGNVAVAGFFNGTADFGGGPLVSAGGSDIFVARYTPAGTHAWSRRFGSTGTDAANSVSPGISDDVFVTGYFNGTVDFGGGPRVSAGDSDIFVARYGATGEHLWSGRSGGTTTDTGYGIVAHWNGRVFTTGSFEGLVDFGGGLLISAGSSDIFLVRHEVNAAEPQITSVTDIGNDQGRRVKIRFERSGHDRSSSLSPILQYEAYRRDDAPPASSTMGSDPAVLSVPQLLADGWTQVGFVAAHGDPTYGIDVPTIGDSTVALGPYYSAFFIRAATSTPTTFYASVVDSGYSVDNLAPDIPGSLLYNGGLLSWNESPAQDFDYFTIYGAPIDDFCSATVVDYTIATDMDVTASPYVYYFVAATDFSGNEGVPISVNTAAGVGGTPERYVLSVSNFPNPFNPRTTVSYTVPSRGSVSIAIYDARGARVATLVDNEAREAGAYRIDWNGRADSGAAVSSGIYFARISHDDAVRTKKMVLLK